MGVREGGGGGGRELALLLLLPTWGGVSLERPFEE
jgi:hypothetical protein